MKRRPTFPIALLAALTAAGSLHAADNWLPMPDKGSSAPAAPATPDKTDDKAAPGPALPASGVGWLFSSDAAAPTANDAAANNAPVSGDAAALLANMKQKDQFVRFWAPYARAFIPWEDDYVALPGYNPLFPSSKGMTTEQAQEKMGSKANVQAGLVTKKSTILLPYPEAQAAVMTIQSMEVGQYGYIHSVKVDKILGPDEFLARDVWLLDPDGTLKEKEGLMLDAEKKAKIIGDSNDAMRRANSNNSNSNNNNSANFGPNASTLISTARTEINDLYKEREKVINRQRSGGYAGPFKVKGYPTAGLVEGQRWSGPSSQVGKSGQGMQIAVVQVVDLKPEKAGSSLSRFGMRDAKNRVPELVPVYMFRTGLTQEQFVTMLAKYGMTPDQFVDLVVTEVRRDNDGAKARVFLALEQARQKWLDDKKAKDEETRKEAEKAAKEAEKAAKDAEKAAKEAERKARQQQRKNNK